MVSPQIPGGDQQRRHWEGEAGMAIDCTSKAAQWENKLRDHQLWDWDDVQTSETSHGNSQKWAPKEWFYYLYHIYLSIFYIMSPLWPLSSSKLWKVAGMPRSTSRATTQARAFLGTPVTIGHTWGLHHVLVGGWALPLWKMMEWKSVGIKWNSQYMGQ